MRLLKNALDLPGVTDRQKLLELRHYFDGHAYEMITYCMQLDDAKEAFEEAVGALVWTDVVDLEPDLVVGTLRGHAQTTERKKEGARQWMCL